MNKILFKNNILNTVIGAIFVVFTILAYFLGWYDSFLPVFVGVILFLLSIKRFLYSFVQTNDKGAKAILIGELVLDLLFSILLVIYENNIALYTGIIIYLRGFTYLIINLVSGRKAVLIQYLMNIGFITLGAFFMFTGIPMFNYFVLFTAIAVFIMGLIYSLFGISGLIETNKKKRPESVEIAPAPDKPKTTSRTDSSSTKDKGEIKVDYSKMTLKELQVIGKNRNLAGITRLNKGELVDVLNRKEL